MYGQTEDSCPSNIVVLNPIGLNNHNSVHIGVQESSFTILPPIDYLSDFEDTDRWTSLENGLDATILDTTILLDKYHLPLDNYV